MPRDKIILACSDCKNRNYFTTKNRRLHPERVEWKKLVFDHGKDTKFPLEGRHKAVKCDTCHTQA